MSKQFKQSGQSLYEYLLILFLISVVAIAALTATGGRVNNFLGHFTIPANKRWSPLKVTGDYLIKGTNEISAMNIRTGKVAWRTEHNSWFEGFIVDADTVYFTSYSHLTALAASTGKIKYKVKLPGQTKEKYRRVGPLLGRQGSYIIASKSNSVACYDNKSGQHFYTWSSMNPKDQGSIRRFSFDTTNEHIYVNAKQSVVCLELSTGKEMWRRKGLRTLGIAKTKPAIAITFHANVKSIMGLSSEGKYLWYHSIPKREAINYEYTRTVAVNDDILVIYSCDERAYLDSVNAKTGRLNWRYGPFAGDKYPNINDLDYLYISRPVVSSTHAYLYDSDANIHQVNLLTGKGSIIAAFNSMATNCISSWMAGTFPTKHRNMGYPIKDITIKNDILYLSSNLPEYGKYGFHAFDTQKRYIRWTSIFEYK